MGFEIQSGDHHGYSARVNKEGHLLTHATTLRKLTNESYGGRAFYLSSDFISLTTTGSFSGIFYIKNTSDNDLHIAQLRTCGLASTQWKLIKNPTAGTLISGASAGYASNLNFESGNPFIGNVYKGANGNTITNGSHMSQWINGVGHSTTDIDGAIIINHNSAIALLCQPSAATTVCANILAYYDID